MMKYITYEEPLKGKIFTEKQMYEVYRERIRQNIQTLNVGNQICSKVEYLKSLVAKRLAFRFAVIFYPKYISKILKRKR